MREFQAFKTSGVFRSLLLIVGITSVCVVVLTARAAVVANARAQAAGADPPIVVAPGAELDRHRDRIAAAAAHSVAALSEWLGPGPAPRVHIHAATAADAPIESGSVTISPPLWSAPRTMDLESQVAFGVARLWWPGLFADPGGRRLADGLSWYLQSRIVEHLHSAASFVPGHSDDAVRFFGGAWPRSIRELSLDRWTAGLGRAEFLSGTGRPGFGDAEPRVALAFGTIERWVGWPALQGALRALAHAAAAGSLSATDAVDMLGDATGTELAWLLLPALDRAQAFDYAIASLTSAEASCDSRPCHRTAVVAVSRGGAAFSGSSRARSGDYQAGDALELRVTFADRQSVSVRWDGRDASRTFEFESPAPATAAQLDPDRMLLLDRNYLDNTRALTGTTNVSVTKWVARWLVWLQNAALTYGALL